MWERSGRVCGNASFEGNGAHRTCPDGLWIAKAFVTANGGEIEASSEGADRGTLVSIRLQAKKPRNLALAVGDDG